MVMAIGHFGNFELYARANHHFPERQFATTYRAVTPPGLNRLLVELRTRSGCLVFERRHESGALRTAMSHGRLVLGLLSDQHAGSGGAWIPFFGQPCSTTTAPAVFALRYKTPLHTAICYRVGLARWRLEIGDAIPTQVAGQRRSSQEIMSDVNRAFEAAIQRDPANWFWVHRRWKANHRKSKRLTPGATVQKPLQEVEDGA
jgi:Kdo2-lipid IVA lauroyltransferase/acyltransferase